MPNRTLGIVLIILGILILAAVFLAGPLHLASAAFGTKHIIGLVIGAIVLIAGFVFAARTKPA